jgi:hypothetical protein
MHGYAGPPVVGARSWMDWDSALPLLPEVTPPDRSVDLAFLAGA